MKYWLRCSTDKLNEITLRMHKEDGYRVSVDVFNPKEDTHILSTNAPEKYRGFVENRATVLDMER